MALRCSSIVDISFQSHNQQALLGLPLAQQRLHVWAYVSLGSHEEYAQEQLTISGSGAPTFSERGVGGGKEGE